VLELATIRVTGQSLWSTIMIAYFPQSMAYWSKQRLSGALPWLGDLYDMLHQMLQTILADRCHLFAPEFPAVKSGATSEGGQQLEIANKWNEQVYRIGETIAHEKSYAAPYRGSTTQHLQGSG
jgi:hypothetical protein